MSNLMINPSLSGRHVLQQQARLPRFQGGRHVGQPSQESAPPSSQKSRSAFYQSPTDDPLAMGALTMLNDYLIFKGVPGLRSIPWLNKLPGVKGFTGIEKVDLPQADLKRLKSTIGPHAVAFIGPNHPEFGTDWIIDKKLSSMAAPRMAGWADADIVNASAITKKFLLANHIIANNGKEQARQDSIKAALRGQGVLLHPEGRVWWHGDKVHPLFPGMMQMTVEAANHPDSGNKPVYLVPVVWKMAFESDVSQGLHRDMAELEKKLKLSVPANLSVGARFFLLHNAMLQHQEDRFGYPKDQQKKDWKLPYFQRQEQFQKFLIETLEKKFGVESKPGATTEQKQVNLERVVARKARENPSQVLPEDRAKQKELYRLAGFSPTLYNRENLTQEHMYENIKRSRQIFLSGMTTMVPQPPGKRTLHIRVAEPIPVREFLRPDMENQQVVATLQRRMQQALQGKLDDINKEIAPSVQRFQVKNPFYDPMYPSPKAKL